MARRLCATTLAVLARTGIRLDLTGAVLGFALKPRGRALPVGEYLAIDPAFSAFGWPEKPVVFKLAIYSTDDEPLGSYVATADSSTKCTVDGRVVSLDQLLESIGEQHDQARVVARKPGALTVFDLNSRNQRDG